MDDTTVFALMTLAATLAVLLLHAAGRSPMLSRKVARGFFMLCLFLAIAGVAATLLSVSGALPRTSSARLVARVLLFRGWLVIGVALAAALVASVRSRGGAAPLVDAESVVRGLCVSVFASFLSVELGKATHDADMREFFVASGLPVWLHYATMAAELACAAALLLPRTRRASAVGLLLIMCGAIGTHVRNGDPLSDSLEAIHLLGILAGIVVLTSLAMSRQMAPGQASLEER